MAHGLTGVGEPITVMALGVAEDTTAVDLHRLAL
jgi:hypothetical protein